MTEDHSQHFIFEHSDVRGQLVHLSTSFQRIMRQHQYPVQVKQLLGETLLAAVLLSATLKHQGQLTVQFQSQGLITLLVAKCNEKKEIRAFAQFDDALSTASMNADSSVSHDPHPLNAGVTSSAADPGTLLMGGQLVVTIDSGTQSQPWQSIIPLSTGSIAENLENYFSQSVQIPTKVTLVVAEQQACCCNYCLSRH